MMLILDILQDIAGKHCINYHMAYDDLIKNNGSIDILVSELLKTYLNTNNRKRA